MLVMHSELVWLRLCLLHAKCVLHMRSRAYIDPTAVVAVTVVVIDFRDCFFLSVHYLICNDIYFFISAFNITHATIRRFPVFKYRTLYGVKFTPDAVTFFVCVSVLHVRTKCI